MNGIPITSLWTDYIKMISLKNIRVKYFLLIILLNYSCENYNDINEYQKLPEDSGYFSHIKTYALKDSLENIFIPNPTDFLVTKSDEIFLSTGYTRQIIKTSPPFLEYEQIGGWGTGPLEYSNPAYLAINEGLLFYSDQSNTLIKSMQISKSNSNNQQFNYSIPSKSGGKKFDVSLPYLAVLNKTPPYISLYKLSKSNVFNLANEFLFFDKYYWFVTHRLNGGNIIIDDDKIYVILVSPYIILTYEYFTKNDSIYVHRVAEYDMAQSDYIMPWSEKNFQRIQKMKSNKERLLYLTESFTRVNNFILLNNKDKKYLLVEIYNPEHISQGKIVHHLVSLESGRLLDVFISKMLILGSNQETLYLYDLESMKTETIYIHKYIFNIDSNDT